jgi:hypothetical protein
MQMQALRAKAKLSILTALILSLSQDPQNGIKAQTLRVTPTHLMDQMITQNQAAKKKRIKPAKEVPLCLPHQPLPKKAFISPSQAWSYTTLSS